MFLADKLNKGGSLGGYQISRSLRFNSADTTYLGRTPSTASNRRTYTWSGWVKRSAIGVGDQRVFEAGASSSNVFWFGFGNDGSSDQFLIQDYSGGFGIQLATTPIYRDPSAWYHVVVAIDTTQATSTNRVKLYINGVQVTVFSTATYPSQNYDTRTNQTVAHDIGGSSVIGGSAYFNGYITEVNFIDGTQLDASSFGETDTQTGVWKPKAYSGSYGTNGFYLNFSDNSNTTAATLGKDYSGNGNNWTPNNFSVTAGAGNDSLVDSPTSYGTDTGVGGTVRGNYATWNAVLQTLGGTASTYTNGNLVASSTSSNWVLGTIRINDAKYYFELVPDSAASTFYLGINSTTDVRIAAYSGGIEASPGGGSNQGSLAAWSNGDIIGVAVDGPNKTVQFYRNGSTYGTLVTYTTALDLWPFARNGGVGSCQVTANFGQRPFANTAPSGYKALCTQNLPTPTIGATTATQAGKFFNPVLYTGTGANLAVTVGFQPDFIWTKSRSATDNQVEVDAVRGIGNILIVNSTAAESAYGAFVSFDTNGFTKAAAESISGRTYVAWNWKANGSGSTNTAGSITSTVSANTTSGFSVVTYTGTGVNATIGHGIGIAPSMVIVKSRSTPASTNTAKWHTYHASLGASSVIWLNETQAAATSANYWNATAPTSSVFSVGTDIFGPNVITTTYVAYCFAPVAGYSAFGSYVGNGSASGPFVYTGFRPAFLLIRSTGVESWFLFDVARGTYNDNMPFLQANTNGPEYAFDTPQIMSNGFKLSTNNASVNGNGNTMIYAAFAQFPFKYSLAR